MIKKNETYWEGGIIENRKKMIKGRTKARQGTRIKPT